MHRQQGNTAQQGNKSTFCAKLRACFRRKTSQIMPRQPILYQNRPMHRAQSLYEIHPEQYLRQSYLVLPRPIQQAQPVPLPPKKNAEDLVKILNPVAKDDISVGIV